MQVVLNADKKSLVQNTLIKGDVQDLTYLTAPSYPIISKANREIQPFISFVGTPDNNTHQWNITRGSGIHYLGRVKYAGSKLFASQPELDAFSVLNMVRQIQWISGGQPIQIMDGEAIKAIVMNNKASVQENVYRYARALNPLTEKLATWVDAVTPVNFVCYLPIFTSWYTTIEKALNTNELDLLQYSVTYKTFSESGMSSSPTIFNGKFENYTYMPDPETYNIMIAKDFSKPILMQTYSTFTERRPITTAFDVNQVVRLEVVSEVVQAAYKTHIFIAKVNTLATAAVYGCPYVPISKVSVAMGGEPYLVDYSKSMVNYEQAWRGMDNHTLAAVPPSAYNGVLSSTSIGYNENQCLTIDWSLGCNRDDATGLASMANLNKPIYSIDVAPVTLPTGDASTNYWVYLVHEYWQILSVQEGTKALAIQAFT